MATGEVHVGDIGTLYRLRVLDDALPFDPTTAATKQLIFLMPAGVVLTKDATVVAEDSPPTSWFLEYIVAAGDGQSGDEFHAKAGRMKVQAYLAWSDGTKFHSDIQATDEDGAELRIYANLGSGA